MRTELVTELFRGKTLGLSRFLYLQAMLVGSGNELHRSRRIFEGMIAVVDICY